jgi:uncharacterized membrane protein
LIKSKRVTKMLKVLSVFLCALASIPFLYFFATVDTGTPLLVLLVGVSCLSVSTVLAVITVEDNSRNLHFIFVLYFTALLIFSMYRIRFNNLSPSDALMEYRSARTTLEQGVWNIKRAGWERYFSSISVSLTPTIVSQISGIDLLSLFLYGYRFIAAILPVVLYYTVNQVFKNAKLSAISAVLFSQLYFNLNKLMNLTRQQVAELFLILTFFVLFKMSHKKKKNYRAYIALIFIFMFSFISSHYTINYFMLPIFVGMFLASLILPLLPKNLSSLLRMSHLNKRSIKSLSVQILALFLVLSLLWWSTAHITSFQWDVIHELDVILGRKTLGTHYQISYIRGSPLGSMVTTWINLGAVLIPIGFLYVAFRKKKNEKLVNWMVACLIMLIFIGIWLTPQQSAAGAYPDRIYVIGSIFFTSFSASILYLLWDRKYLKVLLVFFLLLNLPLNMFLPAHSMYAHYHKQEDVHVEGLVFREVPRNAEFTFQIWANKHFLSSKILVSDIGFINLFYTHASAIAGDTPFLNKSEYDYDYVFLDQFALLQGLWRSGELSYETINVEMMLNQSSVVYNNGRAALISGN